jgi:hypothetical protein
MSCFPPLGSTGPDPSTLLRVEPERGRRLDAVCAEVRDALFTQPPAHVVQTLKIPNMHAKVSHSLRPGPMGIRGILLECSSVGPLECLRPVESLPSA